MANILGIITAVILLASAFVALKNKDRLEMEISDRATAEKNLEVSQDRLKEAQVKSKELPIEITAADAEAASQTELEEELKAEGETLQVTIKEKNEKVESNKESLSEIRDTNSSAGNVQELADNIKAMQGELEELDQVIVSGQATLANTTSQSNAAQREIAKRQKALEDVASGNSLSSLNTRVRSVYPSWGFVTLAGGDNAGVVANSTLDVVRGGEVIAKLLVSAVETSSASASIVPDSLAEGESIQAGDRVVPGTKAKETAKSDS